MRPPPILLSAGLVVGVALAYPLVVDAALGRFGVRPVAGAAFLLGLGSLAIAVRRWKGAAFGGAPQLLGVGLAGAAWMLGERWPLLFVPAVIQAALAWFFLASLREPDCIVERVAKIMQPLVPSWVDGYCRTVTRLWALFFAANALFIGWLAFESPGDAWVRYTSVGLWVVVTVLQGVEFLVRKAWFRYYGGTFVDRLLQPLFPPENTSRGRRSMAYIRRVEQEIAREG
jgi:uncharacterized membrane protein